MTTMNKIDLYEFTKQIKLEKTRECVLKVNFHQLKEIYIYLELENLTPNEIELKEYENLINFTHFFSKYKGLRISKRERITWIYNIKATYEILNRFKLLPKELNIYFELTLPTSRIDCTFEIGNRIFITELGYSYTIDEEYEQQKLNKVNKYINELQYNNYSLVIDGYPFTSNPITQKNYMNKLKNYFN